MRHVKTTLALLVGGTTLLAGATLWMMRRKGESSLRCNERGLNCIDEAIEMSFPASDPPVHRRFS